MKYIVYTLICGLLIISWGCEDFLDEEPISQISAETFYEDASAAEIGLTGVYNRFFNESCYSMIVTFVQVGTDDIKQSSGFASGYKNRVELDPTVAPLTQWGRMYETISNVNFLLEEVDKMAAEDFSLNTRKNEILAEGHFIRGVAYYYLYVGWGSVPLITEFPKDVNDALVAKSPREDILALVKSDLQFAANNLPDVISSYTNDNVTNETKGRASKWAAKSYLARLALQEKDWQLALSLSEEVIESGLFPFASPWRSIFQEPFNSTESIFEQQNDFSPGFFGSGQYGWWFGFDFEWSDDAMNAFEKPDSIGATQGKDIRFDLAYTPHPWSAQFQPNKYLPPRLFEDGGIEQANFVLVRASELYINKAEILNELDFSANKNEVVEILNMVRARSGDPSWENAWFTGVPQGTTGIALLDPNDYTNQEELRQAIRQEKRREHMFEDVLRWVDLYRWNKNYLMEITNSPTEAHLFFPVPPDEIIRNPKLTQNEAYQ